MFIHNNWISGQAEQVGPYPSLACHFHVAQLAHVYEKGHWFLGLQHALDEGVLLVIPWLLVLYHVREHICSCLFL